MPRPKRNLIGQRFHSLVVLADDPFHHARVVCQCACGRLVPMYRKHLKPDGNKSCGCLNGKPAKHTYRPSSLSVGFLPFDGS